MNLDSVAISVVLAPTFFRERKDEDTSPCVNRILRIDALVDGMVVMSGRRLWGKQWMEVGGSMGGDRLPFVAFG